MAFTHGRLTNFFVNEYDLTSYFKSLSVEAPTDTHDSTVFGKSFKTRVPGLKDGFVTAAGLFDGASGAVHDTLSAIIGSEDQVVSAGIGGFAVGDPVVLIQPIESVYRPESTVDDLVSISADFASDDGLDWGVSLHDLSAETASGNETSHDNGAATTNGGVAHLHVTTVSGTSPSMTVNVQHSSDNVNFTTHTSFTAATAATKERISLSGTINQYVRVSWTISGTSPSFTFAVSFARR